MEPFTHTPTEADVEQLAKLKAHPGWAVFTRMMQECHSQVGIQAIEEMETPSARPAGYYKGYIDSIRETLGRVDFLVSELVAQRQVQNEIERLAPVRAYSSSGDTAS